MGVVSRSITAVLSLAILLAGAFARHHHELGAVCEVCLYAPVGRRSADLPTVDASEILSAKVADTRTSEVRAKRSAKQSVRLAPTVPQKPLDGREERSNRINAPPEARYLRDIAAGLNGRAPPLG
jgi:hypothetical protein